MPYKIIIQLAAIYILINTLVYLSADRSIFAPPESTYIDSNDIIKIDTSHGEISAKYMQNPNAKFVILYSHGNAEDLNMLSSLMQNIYNLGFSIISYDYAGYGTSDGSPSEAATYEDILSVYDYLRAQNIQASRIIIFGRSLGSGPSIELAANHQVAGLILEGAFMSAYRVVTYIPLFFFDKYENIAKINKIHVPILFIHGQKDNVIPSIHGKNLYELYKGEKYYLWLPGRGHNDITVDDYTDAIMSFTSKLNT